MKIRSGFVSNSSSSSFCVNLNMISARDVMVLMDYHKLDNHDWWDISVQYDRGLIVGTTNMDNGDLDEYLSANGVNTELFNWS